MLTYLSRFPAKDVETNSLVVFRRAPVTTRETVGEIAVGEGLVQ